jgi:hypothetical protein
MKVPFYLDGMAPKFSTYLVLVLKENLVHEKEILFHPSKLNINRFFQRLIF